MVNYAREKGLIPRRSDPACKIKDLDLRLKSWSESAMVCSLSTVLEMLMVVLIRYSHIRWKQLQVKLGKRQDAKLIVEADWTKRQQTQLNRLAWPYVYLSLLVFFGISVPNFGNIV